MKSYNDLIAGDSFLGLNFLTEAKKQGDTDNIVVSPCSIRAALAMLYEGARWDTAQEIADAAMFSADREARTNQYRNLMGVLNRANPNYTLRFANGLWTAQGYPINERFRNVVINDYRAQAESADFEHNAEGCRRDINEWVSGKTEKKIPELFPNGSLNADTIVALANALYFKGQWDNKFDEQHTQKQDFTLSNGQKVQVEMMRKGAVERNKSGLPEFPYTERDGLQAVALPYQGKELIKLVILPPRNESVDTLIEGLRRIPGESFNFVGRLFDIQISLVQEKFSRLELPKHEVRGSYNLIPLLQAMGIEKVFDEKYSQLEGITSAERLYVNGGFHQTFFKTNEEGSEGAAATGFGVMRELSMPQQKIPKEFVADRPFLEAIVHEPSGALLFLNKIVNPVK